LDKYPALVLHYSGGVLLLRFPRTRSRGGGAAARAARAKKINPPTGDNFKNCLYYTQDNNCPYRSRIDDFKNLKYIPG
jgi:hypothetical protein